MAGAKRAHGTRKRPAVFRALGHDDPPKEIKVAGRAFKRQHIFKHDSWAATALYQDAEGDQVVCKFNRRQSLFGIPLAWIGRRLARREAGFLKQLSDLELIPQYLGEVESDGRKWPTAIARKFIAGELFRRGLKVERAFFDALRQLLDEMHKRGIAYVDLHKRENIVIDAKGRPHPVDFQVALAIGQGWLSGGLIGRKVVTAFQAMDDYHYGKHFLRHLPEALSEEERARFSRPPRLIRWHRAIAVPLREARRKLLTWLKIRDKTGKAHSEVNPEDAFQVVPEEYREK